MKLYKSLPAALKDREEVRAVKLTLKDKIFPPSLFELPNLEEAYLDGDCETFPASIDGWKNLKHLSLKFENNQSDLSSLFSLPRLENLKLISTPIKVFLLPLGHIQAPLKFISIKGCGLEKLPEEVSMLTTLEELHLPQNKLFVLPVAFQDLRKLKRLNLDSNRFLIFPNVIKKMPELKHLSIDGNSFDEDEKARIQREFHIWPS